MSAGRERGGATPGTGRANRPEPAGDPRGGAGEGEEEFLLGTVERVTYADERTLYHVLRLAPEAGSRIPSHGLFRPGRVTAVGKVAEAIEGARVRLVGGWEQHAQHGPQFRFRALEVLPPTDPAGLVRYLASEAFPGVGPTLARRIVDKLGGGALELIRDDPGVLDGLRGLRPEVARDLAERVALRLGTHRALAFLRGLGLGELQSAATVEAFGPDTEARVREDPYVLAREVRGIGFVLADRAARELGLALDDPRRLRAGLLFVLEGAADDGHTLLPRERLKAETAGLLRGEADLAALEAAVEALGAEGLALLEPGPAEGADVDGGAAEGAAVAGARVYLPRLARAEAGVAESLAALLAAGPARSLAGPEALARAEGHARIRLEESQRAAVLGLLATPVGLLTGGPGVGKTTLVRLLVDLAHTAGARIELASPTGRAAKRLTEATGREARTLHRLLEYDSAEHGFQRNSLRPLEADLVIVDEISMLDISLANQLLRAIEPPTRLLLVGDPDQLPSVGPGNVLADLLSSGCVPTFRLSHVFRQQESGYIVHNAHRVLEGQEPELPPPGDLTADFYLFVEDDPEACAERVVDVATRRIPETFGLDWERDVQVIAPMYRGPCGVDALNERLREALGAGGLELVRGGRVWRIGDRVIQTRNDYDKEVFNGDMGHIVAVDPAGGVTVRFPERELVYTAGELSDLQPAFAITVHRSQGGEFPCVVMPLVMQHAVMLQRNLLYTAITRAKRLVVLVGSRRALRLAIDNARQGQRLSALAERLRAACELRGAGPAGRTA